jgi:hypothetical protein
MSKIYLLHSLHLIFALIDYIKMNIIFIKRNTLLTTTPPILSTPINNNSSDSIWPDLTSLQNNNNNVISWENILFVGGRHPLIRYVQFLIACHGLIENLFYLYLSYEVFIFIFFYLFHSILNCISKKRVI